MVEELAARGFAAPPDESEANLRHSLVDVLAGLGPPAEALERRTLIGCLLTLGPLPAAPGSLPQLRAQLSAAQAAERTGPQPVPSSSAAAASSRPPPSRWDPLPDGQAALRVSTPEGQQWVPVPQGITVGEFAEVARAGGYLLAPEGYLLAGGQPAPVTEPLERAAARGEVAWRVPGSRSAAGA